MVYAAIKRLLRSDADEPHQEHRLGTVSNNITRGLKPVLRDPNPRHRSWYGSYNLSSDDVQSSQKMFSILMWSKPFQSTCTFSYLI